MVRRKVPRPTDAELAILRILWERGPSTVRQVHKAMNRAKQTGYTTTLKFLQIMSEKGLVRRDETEWPHVYEPAFTEEKTQGQMVRDLLEKAFAGCFFAAASAAWVRVWPSRAALPSTWPGPGGPT